MLLLLLLLLLYLGHVLEVEALKPVIPIAAGTT